MAGREVVGGLADPAKQHGPGIVCQHRNVVTGGEGAESDPLRLSRRVNSRERPVPVDSQHA
jgi:hypothetical protein